MHLLIFLDYSLLSCGGPAVTRVAAFFTTGWLKCGECPPTSPAILHRIPGAKFELIEQAGHHPEIEQPEAFVARVAAFLASGS